MNRRPSPRPASAGPIRWLGVVAALTCAATPSFAQGPGRRPGGPAAPPTPPANSDVPDIPDADKLLEQLEKIEDTVTKARKTANSAAYDAIREAASNDQKAVALWLECIHELDFRAKDRKEADFRQWRDGPGKRMADGNGPAAMRMNLQYLLLTMRASEADTDAERSEVLSSLMSYLDVLAQNWKSLRDTRGLLDGSALNTPVARRFKLERSAQPKMGWCLSPSSVEEIYEVAILGPLREKQNLTKLQAAWTRRAQHQAAMAAAEGDAGVKQYRESTQPRLEWTMARDLFAAGAPDGAPRMLRVIQTYQGHRDVTFWIDEMKRLLLAAKEAKSGTAAPAPMPVATGEGTTPPVAPTTPPETGGTTPPEAPTTPPEAPPTTPPAPAGDDPFGPEGEIPSTPTTPATPTPNPGVKFPPVPRR